MIIFIILQLKHGNIILSSDHSTIKIWSPNENFKYVDILFHY